MTLNRFSVNVVHQDTECSTSCILIVFSFVDLPQQLKKFTTEKLLKQKSQY